MLFQAGDSRGPRLRLLPGRRRRARGSPRSSTRSGISSHTSTFPACMGFESSTCSRPTTTPTTSPATGASPVPPARRSTSIGSPTPSTPTRPSTTAGSCASARSRSRPCTPPATGPSTPPSCSATRDFGGEPVAVLSGDSLFVGDVARPDLAVEPEEGARDLYRSLHERLFTLPGSVEVWPGHLGGSLCGSSGIDHRTSSTIGFELAHNHAVEFANADEFAADAIASLGDRPPNVEHVVDLNRGPAGRGARCPGAAQPRAPSRSRSPAAPCSSTRAPTISSTRRTSRVRSAPRRTTPASRPRSPRSSRRTSS